MNNNKVRYISNNICGYKPLKTFNLNALNQELQFLYNQVCSIVTAGSENISNTSLTADGDYTQNWDSHQLLFQNISDFSLDFQNTYTIKVNGNNLFFSDVNSTIIGTDGNQAITILPSGFTGVGNSSPAGQFTIGNGAVPYLSYGLGGHWQGQRGSIQWDGVYTSCANSSNKNANGRAGYIAEADFQTDSPCYLALLQYGSNYGLGVDPIDVTGQYLRNYGVFQTGGRNAGMGIYCNEGDLWLSIGRNDISSQFVDFGLHSIYITPWYRHGTQSRTKPGAMVGVNVRKDEAIDAALYVQGDDRRCNGITGVGPVTQFTLNGTVGTDFKRLCSMKATQPSSVSAEFDAIKWDVNGGGTDKNILGVYDTSVEVFKINKNYIQIPKHTTAEINAISSPVEGMIVYNTTLHQICHYNGSEWRKVTDSTM